VLCWSPQAAAMATGDTTGIPAGTCITCVPATGIPSSTAGTSGNAGVTKVVTGGEAGATGVAAAAEAAAWGPLLALLGARVRLTRR
jgi:hypothetical protein